ncbi:hypothetical protein CMI47_05275 [Candidatus Pacearchaeota archaeon]|nr:hypothetical protein [Candidatus Pacearchaeota archaeon]|tara:strand:+ start:212 stop:499 length:288 start_codon:yes stop_codon:yes gene_type:complete
MIAAWLGTKALGLQRWIWLLALLAAIAGGILWLQAREEADDKANQEIGAKVQREGDLRKTIERAETANEAAENIKRDPDARRDGCLRHSRTPENC